MGRELKRVPMDFDWPLKKLWKGYVNPHYVGCPECAGLGETSAMSRLSDLTRLIMLSADDVVRGKSHPYFDHMEGLHHGGGVVSPDMIELARGLSEQEPDRLGFDYGQALRKIIKAAGVSEDWGTCSKCNGEGIPVDKLEAYEAWESTEPPVGDGYQLWETTSEGSPMSPIFGTLDELCQWLDETKASTFGSGTAIAAEWKRMLSEDFVMVEIGPNMIAI